MLEKLKKMGTAALIARYTNAKDEDKALIVQILTGRKYDVTKLKGYKAFEKEKKSEEKVGDVQKAVSAKKTVTNIVVKPAESGAIAKEEKIEKKTEKVKPAKKERVKPESGQIRKQTQPKYDPDRRKFDKDAEKIVAMTEKSMAERSRLLYEKGWTAEEISQNTGWSYTNTKSTLEKAKLAKKQPVVKKK